MISSDNIASFRSRLSELPFWGWDQQSDGVRKVAAFCRQKHEQNGCEFHLEFAGSWFVGVSVDRPVTLIGVAFGEKERNLTDWIVEGQA